MVDLAQNTNLISKYVMSARMQFALVSKSTFSSNILLLEVSFPLDLMPFSNLKSLTAKYIHQVWQKEWDEAIVVSNKLHDIVPKLSDKLLTFYDTREEDTVLTRLQF